MEYFGPKLGQDLGNRAAHRYQEFRGLSPPPGDQRQRPAAADLDIHVFTLPLQWFMNKDESYGVVSTLNSGGGITLMSDLQKRC